jgi:Ni/Fe-hydrogenase subunit HybB-like protein
MHMFGGEKYHALVRPTILTAFLGYLLFIVALLVDLGRPWTIWHMMSTGTTSPRCSRSAGA